jgi:hypothetical protein
VTEQDERRASVRRLPVPITLPSGRVGRGHLLPDLALVQPSEFIRVPGGRRVRHGMIAYVAADVDAAEMLARWERDVGPVVDRPAALVRLQAYVAEVARLKLGNVVELEYLAEGGLRLKKLSDTPPGGFRPKLPQ